MPVLKRIARSLFPELYCRLAAASKFFQFGVAIRVLLKGELEGHPLHNEFIPRLCSTVLDKDAFLLCDIGANVGVFSARVMQYCDNIEIIAFEPQRSNHEELSRMAVRNHNVELRKIGIGSEPGTLTFNQYSQHGLSSFKELRRGAYGAHEEGENPVESYAVEVSTLDKELSNVSYGKKYF